MTEGSNYIEVWSTLAAPFDLECGDAFDCTSGMW